MEGQDLRQTLVTIGISIVMADVMLWIWGGDFYQILPPDWLVGAVETPLISTISRRTGEPIYLKYPMVRLVIFAAAVVIGVVMWWLLNRTRIGMTIRAGVDDRDMLAASGIRIQLVAVFAFGAGLAGLAGVVGGTLHLRARRPGRGGTPCRAVPAPDRPGLPAHRALLAGRGARALGALARTAALAA